MKLSKIFEEKPKQWGFRGDPYFWNHLKGLAENMDMISPDELENWIKTSIFLSTVMIGRMTTKALRDRPPKYLIYVSCNPATLARDLKLLCADGLYKPEKCALFDMFPRTAHFESVCLLSHQ